MKNGQRHLVTMCCTVWMATVSASAQSAFLYTKPDPSAPGGMQGRVVQPQLPIRQILAIPPSSPEKVYEGQVDEGDRRSFRFAGLPMGRYDLFVIYDDRFYEGIQLMRGEDTLTDTDRAQIAEILERSEPFFSVKIIHRLEGTTGRGNEARAVCTFGRERIRRTYKLVLLRQVGPGWQVQRTRELLPIEIGPSEPVESRHHFSPLLSGIRITDRVVDLGELAL